MSLCWSLTVLKTNALASGSSWRIFSKHLITPSIFVDRSPWNHNILLKTSFTIFSIQNLIQGYYYKLASFSVRWCFTVRSWLQSISVIFTCTCTYIWINHTPLDTHDTVSFNWDRKIDWISSTWGVWEIIVLPHLLDLNWLSPKQDQYLFLPSLISSSF